MICSNCNKTIPDDSDFCIYCGSKLVLRNTCKKCGKIILDDSFFCPFCGIAINYDNDNQSEKKIDYHEITKNNWENIDNYKGVSVETENSSLEKKEKKDISPKTKKRIAIITPIVLLTLIVGAYFGTYLFAKKAANEMDYKKAIKLVCFPKVTALHDADFVSYIDSCKLLSSDNYNDFSIARNNFQSYGDYLQSVEMVKECNYLQANKYLDKGYYLDAINAFRKLIKQNPEYKDSHELFVESVTAYAYNCLENGEYSKAYSVIQKNVDEAKELNDVEIGILPVVYEGAVKLYRTGDYDKAASCFNVIPQYKDRDQYIRLIEAHNYIKSILLSDSDYNLLISNLSFEDTKQVIISRLANRFLRGEWRTSTGNNYFKYTKDNSCYYNLPYITLANSYYRIQDGIYSISNGNETKNVFRFTIFDADTIDVYCYKDGSTYRLYRQ